MSEDEPLLSGEETDALLDAMRASEAQQERSVDAVDLTTPDRGLREALAYADRAADRLALEAHKVFLRHLGVSTSFDPEPTEITPFDVFRTAVPSGAALAVLRGAGGSQALMMVGPALVRLVLDRKLGGPPISSVGSEQAAPPDAALSPVDRRLLRPFLEGVVAALGRAWCRPGASVSLGIIIGRPEEYPPIDRSEPVMRLGWRVLPGNVTPDRIHLAVPSTFLFETGPEGKAPPAPPTLTDRRKVFRRLASASVELSAILGTARSSVREVLGLAEGDVLRLGTIAGGPVELSVTGRAIARAKPLIHHGNIAVEIESLCEPQPMQGDV